MRFLCAILAFLVLTLSVQPVCAAVSVADECCSAGTCNEDGNTDEEDGCASGCNPFQVCVCCAFCVVVPHQLTFYALPAVTFNELKWGILPIGLSDEPVSAFWQPPRAA